MLGWWLFEQSKLIWLCRANVAANIGLHMSRVGYLGNNQLSVPSIPPLTIHPSLWPLLPAVALLNNAITPPLNTPDCHFPHKQCWSIWSQTMPWASVSYWGQTGTKQGPNLAGSNLRGGFSRLIWTGNIWIIHHQHLPPHLLQLNNFGGLWAIQTSFTVKYPNSNLMCQIDSYIFCISRGGIQLLPSSAAIVIVAPLRQSWLDKLQPLPSFLPPASQMSPTRLNFRRKPSIRRRLWIWN